MTYQVLKMQNLKNIAKIYVTILRSVQRSKKPGSPGCKEKKLAVAAVYSLQPAFHLLHTKTPARSGPQLTARSSVDPIFFYFPAEERAG